MGLYFVHLEIQACNMDRIGSFVVFGLYLFFSL